MADTTPRRRILRVGAVVVVLVLVVVAARSADRATVTDVLSIPDFGTIRADRLANGTPVFVVSSPAVEPDGEPILDVIQAFDTEIDTPITGLVGWCADAGMFVDAHLGPLYDVRGRRLPSSIQGRELSQTIFEEPHTAVDDLIHREVQPIQGRTQPDDPFEVGQVQQLQAWQVQDRPLLQPLTPPNSCRLPPDPAVADPDAAPVFRRLIDHSFLAGPIDPDASGWQVTDGWLIIDVDGRATWCDAEPTRETQPRCPQPRSDVSVGFTIDRQDVGGIPAILGGPLAVRLEDGVVARAAVMADSTWRGSSLRGTERYVGNYVSLDAVRGTANVRGVQGGGTELCLGAFPGLLTNQAVASAISIGAETLFQIGGVSDPARLAAQSPTRPDVEVQVVIDRATCRALLITDAG
ncbi:MAG: hypothetical protein ACR2HR_00755 [Euzebya sp.]